MNKSDSLHVRGFSLGTKMILITMIVEIIMGTAGIYLAYELLSTQRTDQYRQLLLSRMDAIASKVELNRNNSPRLGLDPLDLKGFTQFQVLDLEGNVLWDTKDASRLRTLILSQHNLFSIAKKSPTPSGSLEFENIQTHERFFGTYKKVMNQYLVLGAVSEAAIKADVLKTLERFIYLALLAFGLSFIAIVLFTHRIVSPVYTLTSAARKIAGGNFEIELDPPSNDEMGMLSESFAMMTQRIRMQIEGEVNQMRIEKEVVDVAELQKNLLPHHEVLSERYELQSYYESATETGGDYWGYLESASHLILYVGDATGHGLPSAMLTAGARGCFSALQTFFRNSPDQTPVPSQFLRYGNQAVLDISLGEIQMTLFVAMYSFAEKKLYFSNAGHNPGWIIRKKEDGYHTHTLLSRGPRLGESSDYNTPKDHSIDFGQGDLLFLYSDGLIDCRDAEGIELGSARVRQTLLQSLNEGKTLAEARQDLIYLVQSQTNGALLEDDITFTLARLT